MIDGYATVKAIAEKRKLKPRTVQIMCTDAKILGSVKFGRDLAIQKDAILPRDGRVVTGKYRDYRKIKEGRKCQ